jgi:hypothetical protein
MQFSPASCNVTPLRSKYSPKHPVLKHSQSVFFRLDEREVWEPWERTFWSLGFWIRDGRTKDSEEVWYSFAIFQYFAVRDC